MASEVDERSASAFVSGLLDGATADRDLQSTLDAVTALCRNAMLRTQSGCPNAHEFRELADAIDAQVTLSMARTPLTSVQTPRALAGILLAADAMRGTDNRIRKAALSTLARTQSARPMTAGHA